MLEMWGKEVNATVNQAGYRWNTALLDGSKIRSIRCICYARCCKKVWESKEKYPWRNNPSENQKKKKKRIMDPVWLTIENN